MGEDKIIAAWNRVNPDNGTKERILRQIQDTMEQKKASRFKGVFRKFAVGAAALFILMLGSIGTAYAASPAFREYLHSLLFPVYTPEEIVSLDNGHMTGSFDLTDVLLSFLDRFNRGEFGGSVTALRKEGYHYSLYRENEDRLRAFVDSSIEGQCIVVYLERLEYEETEGIWQITGYQILEDTAADNMKGRLEPCSEVSAEDTGVPFADENGSEDVSDGCKALSGEAAIYNHILDEYRDMVQNDFYMELRDSDAYDSSFGENVSSEIRFLKQDVYYALYDVDGNGTKELIIAGGGRGGSSSAFSPWNYDLYGYDGDAVVPVFPEMEFGCRTNFSLYENGIIEVFYTSSAAESGVDFYKIAADGIGTELVDSFVMVGHLEGDVPVFAYFQNGGQITEEEYKTKIQSYEVTLTATLEWVQIQ